MKHKVGTYIPSEVSCLILGLEIIGFDRDSFITITPMSDRMTYRKAPDGSVTAFIDRNQVFEVEIKLMKTSPSNAFLQILFDLYLNYGQLFKLPVHISGGGIKSVFYAGDSFIKVEPTVTHSSSQTSNVWKFTCFNATFSEGGSESSDSVFTEIAGAIGIASQVMSILGVSAGGIINSITNVANKTGMGQKLADSFSKMLG